MVSPLVKARLRFAGVALAVPAALMATNVFAAADSTLIGAATSTAQTVSDNVLGAAPYVIPIIAVLLALGMVIRWVFGLLRRSVGR